MKPSKLYFLSAGEASGDIHAANLMKAMKAQDPAVRFIGIGGPRMRAEGLECLMEAERLCVIGLVEVLKNLRFFMKTLRDMGQAMRERDIAAFIAIDFPDFNLRLCKQAKAAGKKVIFYICPQVWAWRKSRIPQIESVVDHLLTIFPFENAIFDQKKLRCTFVGHPLLDEVPVGTERPMAQNGSGHVIMMPGSRHSEISHHMPGMVQFMREFQAKWPAVRFSIPCAETLKPDDLRAWFPNHEPGPGIRISAPGESTDLLEQGDAAIIASGTSTLQGVLCHIPFAIIYKLHPFTFWLGKKIIKLQHVGLVNLVAKREVCREFLQSDFNSTNLTSECERMLWDAGYRRAMLESFRQVREALGDKGASSRAASAILNNS